MADVIEITSDTFQGLVLESEKPVIVDFWAPWCGPCHMIAPVIDEIARDRDDVVVAKVNVDEAPDIAQRYGIQGIPFIGLFENGQLTKNAVGAMPRAGIEAALGLDD
ncbi:MAG: thioredoxin [Thermoleophilia bacterium]|nr:thioredoxin [Thermoleophilia bacterium]